MLMHRHFAVINQGETPLLIFIRALSEESSTKLNCGMRVSEAQWLRRAWKSSGVQIDKPHDSGLDLFPTSWNLSSPPAQLLVAAGILMTSKGQLSDSELLKLTLAGSEEALSILYCRRQRNIYQFALQMSGSPEISEDVTQEAFMVLIRQGGTFDETRGSLNSFLLGIARNLVRRRINREQFYVSLDGDTDDLRIPDECHQSRNLTDELARDETVELVRKAVLSLPARYREVVVLCDL